MKLPMRLYSLETIKNISGSQDRNLKVFKTALGLDVVIRGDEIFVDTEETNVVSFLTQIFQLLEQISDQKVVLTERDILYVIKLAEQDKLEGALELYTKRKLIASTNGGKPIFAKTFMQLAYVKALEQSELIFSVGPAGTGKTYLAVAHAVSQLKENKIRKIILTRPAVEAGESLGFLPGDLKEKVDPYLVPLYDALYEMLGVETTNQLMEKGIIEIAPLAYMRGRTLENAYVILDEAQNTTQKQMKMFLTRLGFSSKMVVTGDMTQIDLPRGVSSGLTQAVTLLTGVEGIDIVAFERIDVIRNPLVQKILERYDEHET